jgi:preprotein translocase subunit SecG
MYTEKKIARCVLFLLGSTHCGVESHETPVAIFERSSNRTPLLTRCGILGNIFLVEGLFLKAMSHHSGTHHKGHRRSMGNLPTRIHLVVLVLVVVVVIVVVVVVVVLLKEEGR